MPRNCSICHHERRQEIDEALVADEPLRQIAQRTGVSRSALDRHRPHIAVTLAASQRAAALESMGDSVWDRFQGGKRQADAIIADAYQSGDYSVALRGLNTQLRQTVLEAEFRTKSRVVKIALGMERNTTSEPERDYSQLSPDELEQYRTLTLKTIVRNGNDADGGNHGSRD